MGQTLSRGGAGFRWFPFKFANWWQNDRMNGLKVLFQIKELNGFSGIASEAIPGGGGPRICGLSGRALSAIPRYRGGAGP